VLSERKQAFNEFMQARNALHCTTMRQQRQAVSAIARRIQPNQFGRCGTIAVPRAGHTLSSKTCRVHRYTRVAH
jgi:hypothetical protein